MDARLRGFAIRGALLLVLFLAAYPFLLPPYRAAVLAVSRAALQGLTPRVNFAVQDDGTWAAAVGSVWNRGSWSFFLESPELGQEIAFSGLALLPALLLATPAGMRERLRLLGTGLGALFVVHVVSVMGVLYFFALACYKNETARACVLAPSSLSFCSHIGTFGVWGLMTWKYWFDASPAPNGVKPVRVKPERRRPAGANTKNR